MPGAGVAAAVDHGVPNAMAGRRVHAMDALKALAIAAVLPVHAGFAAWSSIFNRKDVWLRLILPAFNVPTFLVASGFLYHSAAPVSAATVRRRLVRVLVPYVVASVFVQAVGLSAPIEHWTDVPYQLVTASAYGTYYFVWLLVICIVCTLPLSRAPLWAQVAALVVMCAYAIVTSVRPDFALHQDWFWALRNPVHYAGYFLAGWLLRPRWARARRLALSRAAAVTAVALAGLALYVVANVARDIDQRSFGLLRALYTASVVTIVIVVVSKAGDRVPSWVRTVSNATYTIYLYHELFISILLPATMTWGSITRTATLSAFGLSGSMAVALAGRRLLGPRARLIIGA